MKILIMAAVFIFYSMGFAVTIEEFLKMDEEAQAEFLNTQAEQVDDEAALKLFKKNNANFFASILTAGEEISNVWGDTILEGPYSLVEYPATEILSLYTVNGEIYAVQALVSASAIMTDSCEYDDEVNSWEDDCSEGSITEIFVVGINGNSIDMGDYAEFND